jgi:glycosyltransferase involved in cell wall biosynthesis
MRILHLLSQHPESTGSGIYLRQVIRRAAAAGHCNGLVAGVSGAMAPRLEGLPAENCQFVRFGQGSLDFAIPGMSDVMPYPSTVFREFSEKQLFVYLEAFATAITSAVAIFRPDIIHSHHLWLMSALARDLCPTIPMVTSCHATDLRQFRQSPRYRQMVAPACRRMERVLALGPGQQQEIVELYGVQAERVEVVGAGFDEELFVSAAKALPPPVELLYAGKLSLAKGVDVLLTAFAELERSDLHLHLAGSAAGPEEEFCRLLAARCGGRVTLHGHLAQTALAALMRRCHLFVLPSFYEGLPLVLLEALASGCRLIVNDLPGCRELLQGFDPRLVSFVELPVLASLDRPAEADMVALRQRLGQAIILMADRVTGEETVGMADAVGIGERFGWRAVFARIEVAYAKAMAG